MTESEYLIIFETLFEKHYDSLRLYATRIAGSYEAAEDVVQECFVELWQKRETIDFSTSLSGYLYKAVFNRAMNYLQNKANRMRHDDRCSDQLREELYNMIVEQEENLVYQDLSACIAKGVHTLPDQCRKVFIMSRTYEMKNKEIAEKLGVSVKAVEKQITQALKLLRAYLKKNEILPFLLFALQHFLLL
ncbi:RNA polymerase sigma-70 factor [Bacteroides sp.]